MRKLEEIQKEEKQLYLKEETLSSEVNQVKRVKESYDQHFYEARHFLMMSVISLIKMNKEIF
ncbi:DUF3958 family protein [Enterococcus termitis]